MGINLEEQITKGKDLIDKLRAAGKDVSAVKERVQVLETKLQEQQKKYPAWYTEEDRKAKAVLEGTCRECAHLLLVKDNSVRHEFKGLWCAALKLKLVANVDSCPKFYALSDEIDRLANKWD